MNDVAQTQETATPTEGSTGVDASVSDAGSTSPESGAPAAREFLLSDIGLPDDLRSDASLKDIKNVSELAKSFIHAQKMVGAEKFVVPGKDATDDDWGKVYNQLGRPKDAESYGLKPREGVAEGIISKEGVDGYAQFAHSKGFNTKQANAGLDFYTDMKIAEQAAKQEATDQRNAANIESLKTEFGNSFDKNVQIASSLVNNLKNGDELRQEIDKAGLGTSPVVIKALVELASHFGEDRLEGLDKMNSGSAGSLTPEQAAEELSELDKNKALYDRGHVDNAKLVAKREKLLRDMYPDV